MEDSTEIDAGKLAGAALEALPTQVCVVDRHGRIVAANLAWREFTRSVCSEPSLAAVGSPFEAVLRSMTNGAASNADTFLLALRELLDGKRAAAAIDQHLEGGATPLHIRMHVKAFDLGGERAAMITHEDLTGIDQASRELSHSRIEFEALVNGIDGVVWEADPRTSNFTFVSRGAEKLLGYPREAWYANGFWPAHIHPPDREGAVSYCAQAVSRLENHAFEYRMVASDGRLVWIREIVTVVARDGHPDVLRGVMFDITEKTNADAALRRFRAALDTSADAVLLVDRETMKIVDVNETAAAITRTSREQLVGAQLHPLLVNVDRALLERRFDEILESGERAVMQASVRLPGAQPFPGELHVSALQDERALMVVSLRDVSDRLAVETAQRDRERLFAALFENNNAVKLILDPVSGRIVDANPAAAEFYGYPRERLLRMSIHDINPAPVSEVRAAMESAKTRKETRFEFRHRLASGEIRDVEVHSGPVALAGKRLLFSIIHDISERKHAEEDARQQRELLEGQNAVLKLIANDEPLERSLTEIVRVVEHAAPGSVCSILLVGPDGMTLHPAAAPGLPPEYNEAIDGSRIQEGGSPCAAAAFRRELVIVEDIASDPLWAQSRELAARCNLASCWSNPILSSSGTLLGTFAIYYREARRPSAAELRTIELAAALARVAIDRRNAVAALRHAEEHLRQVFAASPLPIFELDMEGHFRMWNTAAERVFGWTATDALEAPNRIVDASNLDEFSELRDRVLKGEMIKGARVHRRRRDGSVIPLTLHIAPLVDQAGTITGIIAITNTDASDTNR